MQYQVVGRWDQMPTVKLVWSLTLGRASLAGSARHHKPARSGSGKAGRFIHHVLWEHHAIWEQLSAGGNVLMPLGAYPFSERYGWVADRYGLSWQVMYAGNTDIQQTIMPALMFVGNVCGKTEEAINFYISVFSNSNISFLQRYGQGQEPDKAGTIQYAAFTLDGMEFGAMDSAHDHHFTFNEAISLLVPCQRQAEIDYYWEKLSADPQAEQCGWLKDQFGLSWQVWPTVIGEMMQHGTREQVDRLTQAFLPMKKFDLATLQRAYEGI